MLWLQQTACSPHLCIYAKITVVSTIARVTYTHTAHALANSRAKLQERYIYMNDFVEAQLIAICNNLEVDF